MKPGWECVEPVEDSQYRTLAEAHIGVIDGDGYPDNKFNVASSHVPEELKSVVDIIVFKYELEEWICKSMGIKFGTNIKPSEAIDKWLKTHGRRRGYDKKPYKFIKQLNIEILNKEDENFKKLLRILKR